MLARRLVAALLALFTLHLNLLGADAACAKHGKAGAHGAMNMMSAMPQSGSMDAGSHANMTAHSVSGTDEKPCELPAQANCCRALVSCSVVFSCNNQWSVAPTIASRNAITAIVLNAPRSEIVSPDPPPPKARV